MIHAGQQGVGGGGALFCTEITGRFRPQTQTDMGWMVRLLVCICTFMCVRHQYDKENVRLSVTWECGGFTPISPLRRYVSESIFFAPLNICKSVVGKYKSERKENSTMKAVLRCVSITNILVYTPAVDTHLLCLACHPLQPPLGTIDISFYANAAFGYVRTRQHFYRQPFIPACLWPYGPQQNYCWMVNKLLSLCQEPLLHKQTADTHSRGM